MLNYTNRYIFILFATLILYTAYSIIWPVFGLRVTLIIQTLLLLLVCIGAVKYLIASPRSKNSWATWLFVVWITQALAYVLGKSGATTQFKEATFVLLATLPFISQSYNSKKAKYYFYLITVVSIIVFIINFTMMRQVDENSYGGGYFALIALPVLLYFTKNKSLYVQLFISLSIFLMVLMSMKRGDILACILAVVAYYFVILKSSSSKYKILFLLIILVVAGYFIFRYMLNTSELFALRYEQTLEGDTSGRDEIFSSLLHHFRNSPLELKLFGHGFDGTLILVGCRAHSDLLEILLCEGIIGVTIYLCAFFSLLRQTIRVRGRAEKAVLSSILMIWLVKMIFSMFIFSQASIVILVLAAYILNNNLGRQYEY